jgi:hypothetical protein
LIHPEDQLYRHNFKHCIVERFKCGKNL